MWEARVIYDVPTEVNDWVIWCQFMIFHSGMVDVMLEANSALGPRPSGSSNGIPAMIEASRIGKSCKIMMFYPLEV